MKKNLLINNQISVWIKRLVLYACLFTFMVTYGQAQDTIRKEVRVEKSYKPSVPGASKINRLPELTDTVRIEPSVEYSLTTREIQVPYQVQRIQPANMLGEPLTELYKNYVDIGMGNYIKPRIGFRYNVLRSEDWSMGVRMRHESSLGKVKLTDDHKTFAGYHDSKGRIYAKKIGESVKWTGDLELNNKTRHYYGYRPQDTILDRNTIKNKFRQNILNVGLNTGIQSLNDDTGSIRYTIDGSYAYLLDAFNIQEHLMEFEGTMRKRIQSNDVGLEGSYKKYFRNDTADCSLFTIYPFIKRETEEWSVIAGVNINAHKRGDRLTWYYYPRGRLNFKMVDHILKPYLGVDGKMELNSYAKITRENPFIKPGVFPEATNQQLSLYGGLEGKLNSKISYDTRIKYSVVDQMYFYVNDFDHNAVGNMFSIIDDEVEITNYSAEISYQPTDHLSFYFQGDIYNYSLASLEQPWHKPFHELTLAGRYNIQDKIILNGEIIGISKRYAKPEQDDEDPSELEGTTDVNLDMEYRYSKVLSGYLRLNNLLANRYFRYNQYPTQQFNMMLGIKYAL